MRGLAYEDAADLLERALAGDLDERDPRRAEVLARPRRRPGAVGRRAGGRRALPRGRRGRRAPSATHDLLARAALGVAGLTVSVGPVRPEVRALLEEALAGVAEASPLRPRLLARLAIELYYEPPGRRCASA